MVSGDEAGDNGGKFEERAMAVGDRVPNNFLNII